MYHRIQRLIKVKPDDKQVEPLLNPHLSGMTPQMKHFFAGAMQLDYMGSSEFEAINPRHKNFGECMKDLLTASGLTTHRQQIHVKRPSDWKRHIDEKDKVEYPYDIEKIRCNFYMIVPGDKIDESVELLEIIAAGNEQKNNIELYEDTHLRESVYKGRYGCDVNEIGGWFLMDKPALCFFDAGMFSAVDARLSNPKKYMNPELI